MRAKPGRPKAAALRDWLTLEVRPMFDPQRTLPVAEDILLKWRLLMEDGRKAGHTFSQPDLRIAAIVAHQGLRVVSRDRVHCERAGVPVLNPWEFGMSVSATSHSWFCDSFGTPLSRWVSAG